MKIFGQLKYIPLLMVGLAGCSDHGSTSNITDPPVEGGPVSLVSDVQPIFDANCVFCHGAGGNAGLDLRGGLSYGNLVGVAANNSSGELVTPGDPAASVIFQRLTAGGNSMPPVGALPVAVTSVVAQWIEEGALDN